MKRHLIKTLERLLHLRRRTTGRVHAHLVGRWGWYRIWHEFPFHRQVHLTSLILIVFGTLGLVLTATRPALATDYTVSTNSTWCDSGDLPASIGNLTINSGVTLTLGGTSGNAVNGQNTGGTDACSYEAPSSGVSWTMTGTGTLTVNGTIKVQSEISGSTGGTVKIDFATVTVASGGKIHADSTGFLSCNTSGCTGGGAGGGQWTSGYYGGGGGHGGKGGTGHITNGKGGSVNGNSFAPVTLGSGGAGGSQGAGGGAVYINSSGTVTVTGTVSANGEVSNSSVGGGGSGGSIYITAATVAGAGTVTTTGGDGGSASAGAGGGGRVDIRYSTANTFSVANATAATGSTGVAGDAGTIIFIDSTNKDGYIYKTFTFSAAQGIDTNLATTTDGIFNFRDLTLGDASNTATVLAISTGTSPNGKGPTLNLTGNFTLASGSTFSANGTGYSGGSTTGVGPGGGTWASGFYGGGGGYGGAGATGSSSYGVGGPTYGSASAPIDLGSEGGGDLASSSGDGGGAIRINATSGTVTINGTISANGSAGGSSVSAGGSGGSIYITAATTAGTGSITANGGAGGSGSAGGGGGGRLGLYYVTAQNHTGSRTASLGSGGTGGSAGTVTLKSIPAAPTLSSPADADGVSTTPALQFSTTNAGTNENVQYYIQIDDNSDFSSVTQTIDQTASQTGWTGQDRANGTSATAGSSFYASSTSATFTVQTALTTNTTYYWRVRAIASGGSNIYGSYSSSRSFVTNDPPQVSITNTPSQDSSGNIAINYNICDTNHSTLTMRVQFTTNNSIYTTVAAGALSGTNSFGSVTGVSSNCASPSAKTVTFDVSADSNVPASYYSAASGNWKVRIQADDGIANGQINSTASSAFELDNVSPATPTHSSPANASYTNDTTPDLTGSAYSDDTTQTNLRIQIDDNSDFSSVAVDYTKGASGVTFTVGQAVGSGTYTAGSAGQTLADGTYYFRLRYTDSKGNLSSYSTGTSFTVDATSPVAPSSFNIFDTSTGSNNSHQVEWNAATEANFKNYLVLRSTDDVSYSTLSTITDSTIRNYRDSSLDSATTYYYKIRTTDQADTATDTAAVSNKPGAPTLSAISSGTPGTNSATITWTSSENGSSEVRLGTSSGSYGLGVRGNNADSATSHSQLVSNLNPNTTYYYIVRSRDGSGLATTSAENSFTTAAKVSASSLASSVSHTTATLTWNTTGTNTSSVVDWGTSSGSYSRSDGDADASETTHSVTLKGLAPGTTYYWRVNSTDSNLNAITSTEQNLTTTARPAISSVSSGTPGQTSAAITFSTDRSVKDVFVDYIASSTSGACASVSNAKTVSGGIAASAGTSHSVSLTGLSAGTTHRFRVRVIELDASAESANQQVQTIDDNSGACYSFTSATDSTAPTISNLASGNITNTSAVITWETDEPATGLVSVSSSSGFGFASGSQTTANPSANNQKQTAVITGLTRNTTYYFLARSVDGSNNATTAPEASFTTTGDATGPVISGLTASSITTDGALITWTTDEPATTQVNYGQTTNLGSSSAKDEKLDRNHRVTLSGLSGATLYYFQVVSQDANANETKSPVSSTTTLTTQTVPSVSSISLGEISSKTATVSWSSNLAGDSFVDYGLTSSYGSRQGRADDSQTAHSITLSGLKSSTTYYFRVRTKDSNGNEVISSGSSFTTESSEDDVSSDKLAPVISGNEASLSGLTDTRATISWTTNEESTSRVDYGLDQSLNQSQSDDTFVTKHELKLTGLEAGKKYRFQVSSLDRNKNRGKGSVQEFTTAKSSAISDASLVTQELDKLILSVQTTEATKVRALFGAGLDRLDSEVSSLGAETSSHAFVIENLTPGTAYYFQFSVKDKFGQETTTPSFWKFETRALPKITAVNVTDQQATQAVLLVSVNTKAQVIAAYTDLNSKSRSVGSGALAEKHEIRLDGLKPEATIPVALTAIDASGNQAVFQTNVSTTGDRSAPEFQKIETEIIGGSGNKGATIIVSAVLSELATLNGQAGLAASNQTPITTPKNAAAKEQTLVFRNLPSGQFVKFKLIAEDPAGNVTESPDITTFTPEPSKSALTLITTQLETIFGGLGKGLQSLFGK